MKQITIAFAVLMSIAATSQTKKWTLQECLQHAFENNITIKQSELDIENSDIAKSDAFGNFLPTLNISGSNSWNTGLTQNITTGILENQVSRNSSYNASVGLTLFNGLLNQRQMQRAKLAQLAAQYNLDKIKDDISLFIANGFLQVLLNKANLEVIESQNQVTHEQIIRTRELVDAGVLPRGDLLDVKATDASERQSIAIAENSVKISLISLSQLLHIRDYENFDIIDQDFDVIISEISNKSAIEIIDSAKENRSEIKIAEQNMALAKKDLQIAKSSYLPSLRAFFNYNTRESDFTRGLTGGILDPDNPSIIRPIGIVESTGEAVVNVRPNIINQTELNESSLFSQFARNDGISYGVSLNIPVFNGNSVRNNVKRNKINLKRQEFILEQAKLDLESNVYQAHVDANGSRKAYEAAQAAVSAQSLAYDYAKNRYDVGLINAFDFSQAKLRFDNAQVELNRSKFDYIFKLKVLELYFGVPANELKF